MNLLLVHSISIILSINNVFFTQGFSIQKPFNALTTKPTAVTTTSASASTTARSSRSSPSLVLLYATPKYTMPSQQESVELGIRDWPQQTKSSSWSEEAKEGQTLIRYILQGSGTVTVTVTGLAAGSGSGGNSNSNSNQPKKFNTGMLLEVEGPVSLEWNINKDDAEGGDVIILTPGYENTSLFVGAIVGFVAMVGALVALS